MMYEYIEYDTYYRHCYFGCWPDDPHAFLRPTISRRTTGKGEDLFIFFIITLGNTFLWLGRKSSVPLGALYFRGTIKR